MENYKNPETLMFPTAIKKLQAEAKIMLTSTTVSWNEFFILRQAFQHFFLNRPTWTSDMNPISHIRSEMTTEQMLPRLTAKSFCKEGRL